MFISVIDPRDPFGVLVAFPVLAVLGSILFIGMGVTP
jgi:hypothetical protein